MSRARTPTTTDGYAVFTSTASGLHRSVTGAGIYSARFQGGSRSTMGGFLPYILLVMLPSIAITGWAAWRVRSTYAKWSKVDSGIRLSAFDFARQLLDRQGLRDVSIEPVPGQLTDHYDPRGKVLRVSSAVS